MTLPTSQFRRSTSAAPRASLVWRARDLSLNAATGQVGTLVRAATGTSTDSNAVSLTTVRDRPRWHITSGLGAIKLGASEYLGHAFSFLPAAACSGLIDFVEDGTISTIGKPLFAVCGTSWTSPTLYVDVSAGSKYQITHNNSSTVVTSTMTGTAPTVCQRVQIRWHYYADGKVQIFQSIAGAAETSATISGTLAPAATWNGSPPTFWMNGLPGSVYGQNIFLGHVVMGGNQTLAALSQALAY